MTRKNKDEILYWETKEHRNKIKRKSYYKHRDKILLKEKEYREKNREQVKQTKVTSKKKRIEFNKRFVFRVKQMCGCKYCPEHDVRCLEFHHTKSKSYSITLLVRDGYPIKTLKLELRKCIVICSNCHQKLHHRIEGDRVYRIAETIPEKLNIETGLVTSPVCSVA